MRGLSNLLLLCLFGLIACVDQKSSSGSDSILNSSLFVDDHKFIILSDPSDSDISLSGIGKIIVRDAHIYILDNNRKHIFIYDREGKFIRQIAQTGQAPDEYLGAIDFDIKDSCIYIYDDRNNMLQIYSTIDGSHINRIELPFRSRAFSLLENGDLLFAAAKESSDDQIITTGPDGEIKARLLPFEPDDNDERLRFNILQKHRSDAIISYNRPESNDCYLLSALDGTCIRKVNLSEIANNDVYFSSTPFIVNDYLIGNYDKDGVKHFYVAKDNSNSGLRAFSAPVLSLKLNGILMPLCYDEDWIISYIDFDIADALQGYDILNADQKAHIEEGGFILSLYKLKNSTI